MNKEFNEKLNELVKDENVISYFCDFISDAMTTDLKLARKITNNVYKFANKNDLRVAKGWMLYFSGIIYFENSELDKSIEDLTLSYEEFVKTYNKSLIITICNAISFVYSKSGQHALAYEYGMIAIGQAKELDNNILIVTLMNIASNNIESGAYNAAREIMEYIDVNVSYDKLSMRAKHNYLIIFAEIEIHYENYLLARGYLKKVRENLNIKIDEECESDYYKTKAKLENAEGNYDMATIDVESSYMYALKRRNVILEVEMLVQKGIICFNQNDNAVALNLINKAIQRSEEFHLNKTLLDSYKILYDYYIKLRDSKMALEFLEKKRKVLGILNNYRSNKLNFNSEFEQNYEDMNFMKLMLDKTEVLAAIGEKIILTLDTDDLFYSINEEINKLMKVDIFSIIIYDRERREFILRTVDETGTLINKVYEEGEKKLFSTHCINNGEIILIGNYVKEYKKYVKEIRMDGRGVTRPLSAVYVPLIVDKRAIGIMRVESFEENNFNGADIGNLKVLANYVSIALKNAYEYKRIEDIATYDSMTGFLTRREIIKEGNRIHQRYKSKDEVYSVLMIDIDYFKNVNDKYGHVVGDKIIKLVTEEIYKQVRATDFAGRYGGDEFLLICPKVNKIEAQNLAERIKKAVVNGEYIVDDIRISVSVSIGVAEVYAQVNNFMDCVKIADDRLYIVKKDRMKLS